MGEFDKSYRFETNGQGTVTIIGSDGQVVDSRRNENVDSGVAESPSMVDANGNVNLYGEFRMWCDESRNWSDLKKKFGIVEDDLGSGGIR